VTRLGLLAREVGKTTLCQLKDLKLNDDQKLI